MINAIFSLIGDYKGKDKDVLVALGYYERPETFRELITRIKWRISGK